jgi:hypothetical protein
MGNSVGSLLKRICRRFLPDAAIIPHTKGHLRLYPRDGDYWVVEGRGASGNSSTVKLRWGQHELAQTLWQNLKHGGDSKGFQFVFHRDLLSSLLAGGQLTIDTGSATWILQPSRIYEQRGDGTPARPEEEPGMLLEQGYILGSNGLLQKPKNLDADWIEKTLSHYDRARGVFKELFGYDLYVVGGSLLGWARNRDIISFDKDFDTGYVSNLTDPREIQVEFARIVKTLVKRGEKLELVGINKNGQPFIRRHYFFWFAGEDHHLDVFPGMLIDGRYRRPTFVQTELRRDDLFPLRQEQLCGHEILVPRNYEMKLAAVYGPSWRTPDPFWKKILAPELKRFFKQIRLSEDDLLEIAELFPAERDQIRSFVAQKQDKRNQRR